MGEHINLRQARTNTVLPKPSIGLVKVTFNCRKECSTKVMGLSHKVGLITVVLAACGTSAEVTDGGAVDASADVTLLDASLDAPHVTENIVVTVDATKTDVPFRDLVGVNKAPRSWDGKAPNNEYDISAGYKALGISQVRIHDDRLDICAIYTDAKIEDYASGSPVTVTTCTVDPIGGPPHLKWTVKNSATVNDLANYRFDDLDASISATLAAGSKPYVRLGFNYNGPNDVGDIASWAKVATNVYKHIIGAFGPSAVKVDPQYVEVFNEPDGAFWVGSKSDFASLFNATVDGVRAAAADAGKIVKVGGPGFTAEYLQKVNIAGSVANGFASAVTPARLDFFSVHSYNKCDAAMLSTTETFFKNVRAQIDKEGLASKPMHISEWNIGLGKGCGMNFFATAQVQSYASGVLTLMQDAAYNIDVGEFYSGAPPMSVFDFDQAQVGKVIVRPSAWSFWAHSRLVGGTRLATQVCSGGACGSSTAAKAPVIAIAGTVGTKRYAILTNDSASSVATTVRVTNASSGNFTVYVPPSAIQWVTATKSGSRYVMDATSMAALAESIAPVTQPGVMANGGLESNVTLAARSIALVQLP